MKKRFVGIVMAAAMLFSMNMIVFAEEKSDTNPAASEEATVATEESYDSAANMQAKEELAATDETKLVGKSTNDTGAIGVIDLSSITYSSRLRTAGETLVIRVKTANVKRLHFYYDYTKKDGKTGRFQTTSYANEKGNAVYDGATGYWTLTVKIPDDAARGIMYLTDIQMIDTSEGKGKYSYVWDSNQFGNFDEIADLSPYYISIDGASLPSAAAREVAHCTLDTAKGEKWDGVHYTYADGTIAKDVFFCDGTYTYYLMADGTPMKGRLTYHPNGVTVIYFDENGHEVFNSFVNVKKSITGDAVDDICYFDTYGFMYTDKLTYGQNGDTNLYYINPYGVMQRGGYFTFPNGDLGYAEANGALMTNQDSYSPNGQLVHFNALGHAVQ